MHATHCITWLLLVCSESTFRWFDGLIRETNSYNPFDPWSVFSTLTAVVLAVDRIYTTLKRYKTAYDRHRTRKVVCSLRIEPHPNPPVLHTVQSPPLKPNCVRISLYIYFHYIKVVVSVIRRKSMKGCSACLTIILLYYGPEADLGGGGGGVGRFTFRDSTPCRPKGSRLCTILRYPYLVTDLKIF